MTQWRHRPVLHKGYGTYGVVREGRAANVPHLFDGKSRRVGIDSDRQTWVSVVWNPRVAAEPAAA